MLCQFLLHSQTRQLYVCVCAVRSRSVLFNSLQLHGLQPTRLLCPWDSPGKKTGVGSLSLLQGIFPTQGSNPGLPHCGQILYALNHQGSPCLYLSPLFWISFHLGHHRAEFPVLNSRFPLATYFIHSIHRVRDPYCLIQSIPPHFYTELIMY